MTGGTGGNSPAAGRDCVLPATLGGPPSKALYLILYSYFFLKRELQSPCYLDLLLGEESVNFLKSRMEM